SDSRVITAPALFSHSHYPLVGGLLKGWIPSLPWHLLKLKLTGRGDIFFNANEPILLTTLYNGIFAKLFGLKNILFSWENIDYSGKHKGLKGQLHNLLLKWNLGLANAVVCGNRKALEIMSKRTKARVITIPLSGVDGNLFQPGHDSRKGNTLLFAGSLSYRKGIHIILDAMHQLLSRVPDLRLVIVGEGEYEPALMEKIKRLGLEDKVHRVPWVDSQNLMTMYNEADIFLYPSLSHQGWEEQFGYSMAEASLCELPVIATNTGSINEVIQDGVTGILVQENNSEALANAIEELIQDPKKREALGKAGRAFILAHFAYEGVAKKYYNFFKS
ncbi:glycosyltransferase family 4 protein, partial [Candidatus Parcubacteria bacterium]|nr:glycosyltransferase family 4 protein [Candidatus Parcubacteria bacterium]